MDKLTSTLIGFLSFCSLAACQSYYGQSGTSAPVQTNAKCKCLAGQSCFPSTSAWNAFNQTIGGKLINPRPTAYPCYPANNGGDPNTATCANIHANMLLPAFRATLPGTMQSWNQEEDGDHRCAIELANNTNRQCEQGKVPIYGMNALSVDDLKKGMAFAIQNNLRLQIKNSGHDYLGRSTSPGAFMIWTYNMKGMYVQDSWQPTNCSAVAARSAMTLEAGAGWGDIYALLDGPNKYFISGGYTYSVGSSGGYFMNAGGHSMMSPTYGLAVDNIFQIEVITPDGQLRVANQCQNPDLFWALKGGGPSYGIVTNVTYQIYPSPPNWTSLQVFIVPTAAAGLADDQLIQLLTIYGGQQTQIDANRWGGYWECNNQIGFVGTFVYPVSQATITPSINNFTAAFQSMADAGLVTIKANITGTWKSFWDWRKNHNWPGPLDIDFTGFRGFLGSRLIPQSAFSDPATFAKNMVASLKFSNFLVGLFGAGLGVRERDTNNQATSETHGWRTAMLHAIYLSVWNFDTPQTQVDQISQNLQTGIDLLVKAYPNSGSYMNEAYLMNDYKQQYWGMDNYNRLLGIKQQYDPNNVFVCRQCVGSDAWSTDGNCPLS